MNITPYELQNKIIYDRSYMVNSHNRYHDEYHSAVNRIFATFVAILSLLVVYSNFGFIGVIATVAGVLSAFFALLVAVWIVCIVLFEVIPEVFNWLRGR